MSVIDQLLGKKPQTAHIDICLDPEQGERLVAARQKVKQARLEAERDREDGEAAARAAEADDAYEAALAAAKGYTVRLVFQAVDPGELDRLKSEHRPT